MPNDELPDIPTECPVSGKPLHVTELTCEESGVVIRGKFRLPDGAEMPDEQRKFLSVFIRARGVISTVERELGLSYPTVRSKLDKLLDSMNLAPIKEDTKKTDDKKKTAAKRRKILKDLEDEKITAAQAKKKLQGLKD